MDGGDPDVSAKAAEHSMKRKGEISQKDSWLLEEIGKKIR
jgi:hypothetical protein